MIGMVELRYNRRRVHLPYSLLSCYFNRVTVFGVSAMALLAVLIALRITRGVDLSDESYYAIFIDDWLKGGINTSAFLSVHQTAALVVYPAAWLYTKLTGSSEGLLLFLRTIFLLGAVVSSFF